MILVDDHFIAVNKAAGVVVGSHSGDDSSVSQALYEEFGERDLRAVNRIDRPVSGVVLFARSKVAMEKASALFRNRQVNKLYWAIVEKIVEGNAHLEHRLAHDQKHKKARIDEANGKQAMLDLSIVKTLDNYTMLEVVPSTGRFHQIRVQLAEFGHPIKGDVKYGARRRNRDRAIHLHARSLSFEHPITGEPLFIAANPASDPLWDLWPQQLPKN